MTEQFQFLDTAPAAGQVNGSPGSDADEAALTARDPVAVRDFAEGPLAAVLAVRAIEVRRKRNGEDFLQLVLGDRTGQVRALSWDDVADRRVLCEPGAMIWVEGEFKDDQRWGATLTIRRLRAARDGEYDAADFVPTAEVPVERLEGDMRDLVATIQSPQLQVLLDRLLGEGTATWERFREAPAAKYYHQAYRHGLLDHALSVAQAVSAAASAFPGIDRDVAVTGALLHDIGKTLAYNDDPCAIDLTDAGRLQGEIPLGYYLVRSAIDSIDGFDPALAQAVLHIILSHHGSYENGSPVIPATREATLVHTMDNLGGKLGSFDRIERELPDGEAWSRFDRGIDSAAYFGSRAA
jgi:3'-5' exoribonuclease